MQPRVNHRKISLGVVLTCLVCVLGAGAGFSGAAGRGNTPRGLSEARYVSHAEPQQPIRVVMALDLRDHDGVEALLEAQQDPASPLYHQWISPEEFQERFGPLPEDLEAAREFLEGQGFTHISQPTSTMVMGEGDVGTAEAAFGVTINTYEYHGRRVYANTDDPVLPSHLAPKVARIGGLDNLTRMFPHIRSKAAVDPDYLLSGTNYMLGRDSQLAYGEKTAFFDAGMKGIPGAELAVASSFNIDAASINNILNREGGAGSGYTPFTPASSGPHTLSTTCVPGAGSDPSPGCLNDLSGVDSIETALDVSLAASIANNNHIGVYLTRDAATSSFGVVYQYLADHASTIKVVSHSWGLCLSLMNPTDILADDNAFAQAAAGGQAWFVATGDAGSNDCPSGSGGANPDVDYPASSPYVAAAGGASQDPNGAFDGTGFLAGYPPNGETACSDAGGGEATAGVTEPRPSWQTGPGVPAGVNRLVPDISMHFGTCTTPSTGRPFLTVAGPFLWITSGTSADAPQWAGYWAVANQVAGSNLGPAPPLLWRVLRSEAGTSYSSSFHDITTGSNGLFTAGAGYDRATGIGTPKFDNLYPALATLTAPGTLQGTVTAGGPAAAGAKVTASGLPGTYTATTDGSGFYQFGGTVPPGSYSVTAASGGYVSSTAPGVSVTSGSTTTQDFTLSTLAPTSGCLTDTTQAQLQAGTPSINLDLNTSPGDAKLKVASGGTVADQDTLADVLGAGFTNTSWAGQTFTAGVTGQLTRVDLFLFCSACSGANPNITVSIRNTASSLPTGADLATATIPGSSDPGGGWFSASFGTPATVTAGTVYAVVFRLAASRTGTQAYVYSGTTAAGGFGDVYTGGRRCTSTNSGSTWSCATTTTAAADVDFVTWVTNPVIFASSADLTSSLKDANSLPSGAPHWTSLSWTAATPANTSVKFQAASSNSPSGPFSFIGPDGTPGTFFTSSPATLPTAFFTGRYFESKAFLGTTSASVTPTLSDVTVCSDNTCTGLAAGTACGNSSSNACDAPDTCDGSGTCVTNHAPAATLCGDAGTACTNQDLCDGLGACVDNGFKAAGTGCGSPSSGNCDNPDTCDGAGGCQANHVPDLTACDDGNACTSGESCSAGVCANGTITLPPAINNSVSASGSSTTTIAWTDPPGLYNVYRGSRSAGATPWSFNQTCLNSHISTSSTLDSAPLATGAAFFYLVTRIDSCAESTPGNDSGGTPRPIPAPCP